MGKNRQFLSKHVRNEVGNFVEPEGEQFLVSVRYRCEDNTLIGRRAHLAESEHLEQCLHMCTALHASEKYAMCFQTQVQLVRSRGGNTMECESSDGSASLYWLPSKFSKVIWAQV